MDDTDTTQGAQAETQEQIGEDALHVAEDAVEAAVPALVEDEMKDGTAEAVEKGLEAGAEVVEKEAPSVLGEEWAAIKAWVRDEIEHARMGHSRETREQINP